MLVLPDYIYNIFLVVLTIILALSTFWLTLYFINRKKIKKKMPLKNFFPKLSIIIPAHNEGESIKNTVQSVLNSNYHKNKYEIIVVDDGSTDNTAKIAKKLPVRLISYYPNKGKVYALNKGISKAKSELIVTLDSDTELEPYALRLMVQYFEDPKVGAVSGAYKPKGRFSLGDGILKFFLQKLQFLEYLGFAMIRKQQESLESILIVPGAIAAYRKQALKKVGGFDPDTLIEDYDVTLKIHKAGYKVRSEKFAIGWIRAPRTAKKLISQRTRWYRGGIQVLFKHKDIFRTHLGPVTFVWWIEAFGLFFQLFVFSLIGINTAYKFYTSESTLDVMFFEWISKLSQLQIGFFDIMIILVISIFIISLITTTISIRLMGERYRKILLFPLLMVYGSILFFVFLKSFIQELIGAERKW